MSGETLVMQPLKVPAHMTTKCANKMERAQVHNIILDVNTVAIIRSITGGGMYKILLY